MDSERLPCLSEIVSILALGYLRSRKREAIEMAHKSAPALEKALDDVAPRGRVASPEDRTPETERDA